jgi:hypothetical protein
MAQETDGFIKSTDMKTRDSSGDKSSFRGYVHKLMITLSQEERKKKTLF